MKINIKKTLYIVHKSIKFNFSFYCIHELNQRQTSFFIIFYHQIIVEIQVLCKKILKMNDNIKNEFWCLLKIIRCEIELNKFYESKIVKNNYFSWFWRYFIWNEKIWNIGGSWVAWSYVFIIIDIYFYLNILHIIYNDFNLRF